MPLSSPSVRAFPSHLPGSRSLRWRLQIWHAIVLLSVLILFGLYVYHLQWETRMQHIDTELNRTADIISSRLRRLFVPPRPAGQPPGGQPGGPNPGGPNPGGPNPFQPGGNPMRRDESGQDGNRQEGNRPEGNPGGGTTTQDANQLPAARERDNTDPGRAPRGDGPPREPGSREPGPRNDRDRGNRDRNDGDRNDRDGRNNGGGDRGNDRNGDRGNDRGRNAGPPVWPWRVPGSVAPEEFINSNETSSPIYFLIWDRDGHILEKSTYAPDTSFPGLRTPSDGFPIRTTQSRGLFREVILVRWFDINVLVGRSMEHDLAAHRRSGLVLVSVGSLITLIGLAGGWWFTSRAILPIQVMSDTAASISAENLSERINLTETDSELGQLAEVLNQAFDRLHQAFERQTQFTADASHELRTPVAVILAQTQMSLLKPRSPEDYQASLQACQRAAKRMKKLIDSLLQLARIDAVKQPVPYRPVALDDLLRDLVSLLETKAAETDVRLELQAIPCQVLADADRLDQLMMNLLSNAIRYNRVGGSVTITMECEPEHVTVTVRDTGEGIPAESIPLLFDRFYRVDASRSNPEGGTGLGLSISKAIVDAHGGTIRIESEVGVGTSVVVRLPRIAETPRLGADMSSTAEPATARIG